MPNARYVVKEGDTLWDIAGQHLGDPMEWPRIYSYNNRTEVVRITGNAVIDPDLIYPNQVLLLPILASAPQQSPQPAPVQAPNPSSGQRVNPGSPPDRLSDRLGNLTVPFTVQYKLDDLPIMVSRGPGFTVTIKMSGSVVVELGREVPVTYVTNRGMELSYKAQTDAALEQLLSEAKVTWNRQSGVISFQNMMIAKSVVPAGPSTAVGVEVASNKPLPVLKAEIRFPKLQGHIRAHQYLAMNVKVVIELTPEPLDPVRVPVPIPEPVRVPLTTPQRQPMPVEEITAWAFLAGAVLLAGTLIADLFGGVSVLDDPVTVPAALALMGFGVVVHEVPGVTPIEPR